MGARLEGRIIAIAGASSGIGLATARLCAAEGAAVVMLARGKDRLEAEAAPISATPIVCDVADPGSVRVAFATVGERFGKLHALLNVAGVARVRKIEDASDGDIAYVIGINLLGPIYTSRAAIPLLRQAGGGDIINVSSEITGDYLPYMVLYGTSKGGLETFSRMMAHELKESGIRVCTYISGTTATGFGVNFAAEDIEQAAQAWMDSGYLTRVAGAGMDPDWMAEAFVFQLTRPREQVIDVIRVRSFAPGSGEL